MTTADTTDRTLQASNGGVVQRLIDEGHSFDFFKAIWLLERHAEGEPVGHRGPVSAEPFRFRPAVSVGFPSTDVRRISHCSDPISGQPFFRVDSTFLGLYGVSSPLPSQYAVEILRDVHAHTEGPDAAKQAASDERQGDTKGDTDVAPDATPTRDFLDIFHHRIISLFYRAWLKYRYDMQFGMEGRDSLTGYLLLLLGCTGGLEESALGVDPVRMIRYAGLLTQHPKSANTLRGMLADYWSDLNVSVDQCVGRWVAIPLTDMNRIGQANARLGVDLNIGEQVYDLNGSFNIGLGPVDWDTYLSFLPDGPGFAETQSLVRLYCTDPLSSTIEIKLKKNQVPEMVLGSGGDAGRLGFTSWMRTEDVGETSVFFETRSKSTAAERN